MKRKWTRGEKWLWAAPVGFGLVALGALWGPDVARRALSKPPPKRPPFFTTSDTRIGSLALSGNGKVLAVGGERYGVTNLLPGSGTVFLWSARPQEPLASIAPAYTVSPATGSTVGFDTDALALSPDAKSIGFARVGSNWTLYDLATRKPRWRFSSFACDAQFSRDGRLIALSDYNFISVVTANNGALRARWKRAGLSNSQDIALSPDGQWVASIGPYNSSNPIELHRVGENKESPPRAAGYFKGV